MRIVHLSDIHLSKSNYDEFQNNYKSALIKDLLAYNNPIPIDLIIITGDLVDKGGYSLFEIPAFEKESCPYNIFEIVFLKPIIQALKIDKHRILFIPGNHDIDEREILLFDESEMIRNINNTSINNFLLENIIFKHSHRIRKFKEFEERYHDGNLSYKYSQNQSTYIFHDKKSDTKVGFLLINDSWRCKSIKLVKDDAKHYFGIQQFYDGIEFLDGFSTELNICLLHHSTDDYIEGDAVKGILQRKNIELFLYGHFHDTDTNVLYTPHGNCKGFRGRATLFKPEEKESKYHSGYQILDIDLNTFILTQIHYRKYNNSDTSKSFNMDLETAPNNGIDKNHSNNDKGFELQRDGRKNKKSELDINQFKS
jgi:predicted phosphodiesterase